MRGFILITTVIMIGIISLIWISLAQNVWFYSKLTQSRMSKQSYDHALEETIMPMIRSHNCIINEQNPYRLKQRFIEGKYCTWRQKEYAFHYVLADLGLFPCMKVYAQQQGTHQWLLIVGSSHQAMVQVRVAESAVTEACNQKMMRIISPGIISFTAEA